MAKKAKKAPARKTATRPVPATFKRTAEPARTMELVVHDPARLLPQAVAAPQASGLALNDDVAIGALGLVEIKLTKEEEAVLARPIDPAKIAVKPTGEAYYPHPEYTRWFNEAFGRTGWSIRPVSKPVKVDNAVALHYMLFIHGQPVAYALGEQEYFPNNKRQSWGEAIESTVASALRRCAKRLGVGLELWDKRFLDRFTHEHCVVVPVRRKGEIERWYRRKDDPPFLGEQAQEGGYRQQYREEGGPGPSRQSRLPAARTGDENRPISDKQRLRLYVIAKKHGHSESGVKTWLKNVYGYESSRKIARKDYEAICNALEKPGALPTSKPAAVHEPELVDDAPEPITSEDIPWSLGYDDRE